ncbi:hypothetical protein [Nocardia nova]|uniref:hypothetical protein n=1 Tax=Nocardia nova TaxID=37330 RepID=UPI0033D46FC4
MAEDVADSSAPPQDTAPQDVGASNTTPVDSAAEAAEKEPIKDSPEVEEVKPPGSADAKNTSEASRDEYAGAATSTPKAVAAATGAGRAKKPGRRAVGSRAEELQRRHDLQLRAEVEEAYKSAKRRSKEWGPAPIRISAEAKTRLARRREQDEETFGVKFAETHYLDVAIANVPDSPQDAVQWVEEYLDGLGLKAPDAVGTTGRLKIETSARFDRITRRIRTTHGYGRIGHLQNAALLRLLDALDRADEWTGPTIVDLDAS